MRIDQSNVYRLQRPRDRAAGSKSDVVIVCDCGASDSIRARGNTPTEVIGQRFRQRGWQVDAPGKKAACRECQMKKTANGAAPTSAAQISMVASVRLLDEHFDKENGRYEQGWSDASIAKQVGLAETAIASLRETAYGPLAVDPEIAKIEHEVSKVSQRVDQSQRELGGLIQTEMDDIRKVLAEIQCRLLEANNGRISPSGAA